MRRAQAGARTDAFTNTHDSEQEFLVSDFPCLAAVLWKLDDEFVCYFTFIRQLILPCVVFG